ncbi:hypothetical protein M4I21_06075 [Cellulophaga sp. 20_2_10]|nr:hypothetical protein [Cellulophaga sp. 20_2_10]MCL5245367.1 hypothetical protein [Cellulophaga sp. 20_2_10]
MFLCSALLWNIFATFSCVLSSGLLIAPTAIIAPKPRARGPLGLLG